MSDPTYVIMPVLGARDYTRAAIADLLIQSVPTRLLVINQGVDNVFRDELEGIAEQHPDRVLVWHHVPPLVSLSATWNRALDFVWACGGEEALVVNNDVRLAPITLGALKINMDRTNCLFITAVGVTEPQYTKWRAEGDELFSIDTTSGVPPNQTGGPDFSCFLISRACHTRFRFDESFIPAYCEDLDYHRRLLLAGEGHRIFSVNLPYLHYGAGTLKTASDGQKAAIQAAISAGSRAYYEQKWGGPVNQERFFAPFGDWTQWNAPFPPPIPPEPDHAEDGGVEPEPDPRATTPWLQAHPPSAENGISDVSA